MSGFTSTDVRMFLKDYLDRQLEARKSPALDDLPEDCDLLVSGIIADSIDFLNLLAALQEFVGRDIDFEVLDPEEMSIVGPLCRFVSLQMNK